MMIDIGSPMKLTVHMSSVFARSRRHEPASPMYASSVNATNRQSTSSTRSLRSESERLIVDEDLAAADCRHHRREVWRIRLVRIGAAIGVDERQRATDVVAHRKDAQQAIESRLERRIGSQTAAKPLLGARVAAVLGDAAQEISARRG